MIVTFVSNYINHHQTPFCEAMSGMDEVEFYFIQTSPMEQKRIDMGWGVDPKAFPYVLTYYDEKEKCSELIRSSDVVIFGWTDDVVAELEGERLSSGRLSFRLSERIYREGQWKMITPRGLKKKYHEHFVYRNKPVYLLCAGAYVASDFDLIHSYPSKKLKWGYFPKVAFDGKKEPVSNDRKIRLCWAGRLIKLKHAEFAINAAKELTNRGFDFELEIIGDGNQKEILMKLSDEFGLDDKVTFKGSLVPQDVLKEMAKADVFLFNSNFLEGWGAVVNEAMASACCVVASNEAGAVPFLIQDGVNGLSYNNGNYEEFKNKMLYLFENKEKIALLGDNAKRTIDTLWNADNAAREFVRFSKEFLDGKEPEFAQY